MHSLTILLSTADPPTAPTGTQPPQTQSRHHSPYAVLTHPPPHPPQNTPITNITSTPPPTVDPVQYGLEVVALPRVLAVKQLQQLEHKVLVDVPLGHLGVGVVGDDVAQQELVDDLGGGRFDALLRACGCVDRPAARNRLQLTLEPASPSCSHNACRCA